MNLPLASSAGLKVSTVSILPLNSNMECERVQACTLAVQVTSVVPSQKPTVSPYHCGTFCTCCLPIKNLAQEIGGDAGEELDVPGRHGELEIAALRGLRPPAHESFGIAEGRFPLRRVIDGLVVIHLHHALLIFGSEQRQDGGDLVHGAPDPLGAVIGLLVASVVAIPIGRGGFGVNGGSALGLGGREQGFVMFLGGLIRIGADDFFARVIGAAIAPRSRGRGIVRRCGARSRYRLAGAGYCNGNSADRTTEADLYRNF